MWQARRGTVSHWLVTISAIVAFALVDCSSSSSGGTANLCAAGDYVICAHPSGCEARKECGVDGTFGDCECTTPGAHGGSAGSGSGGSQPTNHAGQAGQGGEVAEGGAPQMGGSGGEAGAGGECSSECCHDDDCPDGDPAQCLQGKCVLGACTTEGCAAGQSCVEGSCKGRVWSCEGACELEPPSQVACAPPSGCADQSAMCPHAMPCPMVGEVATYGAGPDYTVPSATCVGTGERCLGWRCECVEQ